MPIKPNRIIYLNGGGPFAIDTFVAKKFADAELASKELSGRFKPSPSFETVVPVYRAAYLEEYDLIRKSAYKRFVQPPFLGHLFLYSGTIYATQIALTLSKTRPSVVMRCAIRKSFLDRYEHTYTITGLDEQCWSIAISDLDKLNQSLVEDIRVEKMLFDDK